jgi:hypothetical protein
MLLYVYIGVAFVAGFILAYLLQWIKISRVKKEFKRTGGLLESERLIRENMNKEHAFLMQSSEAALLKANEKLKAAEKLIRIMDGDILLLQKSNEETEALLQAGEPAVHEMKMKLIEANNMIARYKAQIGK